MDKEFENHILKLAYNDKFYKFVDITSEKPDFVVESSDGNKFGVEITENFINGSNARLEKQKGYTSLLLDERRFLHKDDKKNLTLGVAKFFDSNRKAFYNRECIIQKAPTINDYIKSIAKRITEKENKFGNYDHSISHINLLIFDNENLLILSEVESFFDIFFTREIIDKLITSSFREIDFITKFREGSFVIPLKASLFLSRLYMFNNFWFSEIRDKTNIITDDYMEMLFYCLYREGFDNINVITGGDNYIELFYSGVGFAVLSENKEDFQIKLYSDCKISCSPVPQKMQLEKSQYENEFLAYSTYVNTHTFNTPLARKCENI